MILRKIGAAYNQGRRSLDKRPFEWMLAVVTTGWGLSLGSPIETFESSRSYVVFKQLGPENLWAFLCFWGGLARLAFLWINGSWARTAALRFLASFSTLILWFIATVAFALAGNQSTGLYLYPTFFVIEFSCMLAAGYEAGRLEMAQYHKLKERVRQGTMSARAAIVFGVLGVDRGTNDRDATRL